MSSELVMLLRQSQLSLSFKTRQKCAARIEALEAENAWLRREFDRLQTKAAAAVDRTRDLELVLARRAREGGNNA